MKKGKFFVLGMLAMALALSFVLAGCDNTTNGDDDTPVDDALTGTWVGTVNNAQIKIVAAKGSFKAYRISSTEQEIERGTYTVSGTTVTIKITEINTVMFGGADTWSTYANLSAAYKKELGNTDTFPGTIADNSFTLMGTTFTKQG
jgi:predicted small secreted protein